MMKKEEKDKYEAPLTRRTQVDLENGFMKASVFEPDDSHDKGLSTEEHQFADPSKDWEFDYGNDSWD